jgi:hypothetical protein
MKDGLKYIVGKRIVAVIVATCRTAAAPASVPSYHVTAQETLESLMTRTLHAWNEAKAALDNARGR